MKNLKLKKIRSGRYEAKDNGYKVVIDLYEGKWMCNLYDADGDHEGSWTCKTKKEAIGCIEEYFAI